MKKEITVVLIFTLLTATAILPVAGDVNVNSPDQDEQIIRVKEETSSENGDSIDWWPMFKHDLSNTGYSSSLVSNVSKKIRTFKTGGDVKSSPAIFNDRLYIGSNDDKIYCLNITDGSFIWNFTAEGDFRSSPIVYDGMIYVGSRDEYLYCLDAIGNGDGTTDMYWRFDTGLEITASPAVNEGRVFIGSGPGRFYCLNAYNGSVIWYFPINAYIAASPAVMNDIVYMVGYDGNVRAIYIDNGTQLWQKSIGSTPRSSPAIFDGKVYVGSDGRNILCLNASNGSTIWSYQTDWWVYSSPSIAYGNVYVGSNDDKLYCLNAFNGSLIWNFTTGGDVWSSPAIADGKIFVGSYDNHLYCLDAFNGSLIWKYQTGNKVRSSPAVVDGKIYVGSDDYKIYSFGWGNNPPYPASNPTPENGELCSARTNLSWTGEDPNPLDNLTYDIYLGTSSPPPLIESNWSTTIYDPEFLDDETTYYWKIVTWDEHGASADGPIWNFTTAISIGEAVDNYDLIWSTGGDTEWIGQDQVYFFGDDAAQSKEISHYENTWMKTTVIGPGILKFYWNVSSELDYDFLIFYINGEEQDRISGEVNWEQKIYNLTPGEYELIWNYSKDVYVNHGHDCGWVDYVEWIENRPPSTPEITGPTEGTAGEEYDFTFVALDPDENEFFYYIDWDDGSFEEWIGPHSNGEEVVVSHTWEERGTYTIRAKAKDIYDAESEWGYLEVEMPIDQYSIYTLLLRFLDRLPRVFPILRHLLGV